MYTVDYYKLISENPNDPYIICLIDFLNEIIKLNNNNIYSIIMFGGLVRDKAPILGWSDIDLIIIFISNSRSRHYS